MKTSPDKHWPAPGVVILGGRVAMLGEGDRAKLRQGLNWAWLCWGGDNGA